MICFNKVDVFSYDPGFLDVDKPQNVSESENAS